MSTRTHADRIAYISALELAEPRASALGLAREPRLKVEPDQPSAAVVDGEVVSFAAGLSLQHRSDVMNSFLLAQLAATKKYNRETQTIEWYGLYHEVLEKVGWVMQAFDFTKFSATGGSATVDSVVLTILGALATGNQLALVRTTINALQGKASESKAVKLFETASHTMDKGNFQLGIAVDDGGIVATKLGVFYFHSSQTVTRLFGWTFADSDTSFYQGAETVTLNEDVYGQVRQQIIEKLGDKAQLYVANIDL
jgi:hypothetical protein